MKVKLSTLRNQIRKELLSEKFRTKYKGIRTAAQVSSEKTGSVLSKSGDKYYLGDKVTGLSGGRLTKIMKELEQFVNAEYPELGLRIETNGITRDLAKAADPGGNKARISGSKHGAGLAHDLKYHTTKHGEYTNYAKNNAVLAKDEKFVKLLDKFNKSQSDLNWGGTWGGSDPANGVVKGRGITELHHWEISDRELVNYFEKIKDAIETLGFKVSDMISSKKRAAFYKALLENPENFLADQQQS